jgi:hypothetical protein
MPRPWGSRRAATGAGRDPQTCRQTVMDRDHRVCRSRAADLAFLTRSHGPQRCGLPYVESRCRSRTEEVRGSNPLTSTPHTSRSERRRSDIGGALVVPGAARGHAGATPGPPTQPDNGAPGRRLDGAVVDLDRETCGPRPTPRPSRSHPLQPDGGSSRRGLAAAVHTRSV